MSSPRLGKVAVRDRTMVTTTDAERKVVTPAGLQEGIDAIVASFPQGRSFVRPRWQPETDDTKLYQKFIRHIYQFFSCPEQL